MHRRRGDMSRDTADTRLPFHRWDAAGRAPWAARQMQIPFDHRGLVGEHDWVGTLLLKREAKVNVPHGLARYRAGGPGDR